MTYYYWKDGSQWRWHLKAANRKIIAEGEGYKNEADCLSAIELIKKSSAPVKKSSAPVKKEGAPQPFRSSNAPRRASHIVLAQKVIPICA